MKPALEWTAEVTPPAGIKSEKLVEEPTAVEAQLPPEAEAEKTVAAAPPEVPLPTGEEAGAAPVEKPEETLETMQAVSEANQTTLSDARNSVNLGKPSQALESYNKLVVRNYQLDEIIKDLQDALYRFPVDVGFWVTLGDAHFRSGDLQAALSAYTQAEELAR